MITLFAISLFGLTAGAVWALSRFLKRDQRHIANASSQAALPELSNEQLAQALEDMDVQSSLAELRQGTDLDFAHAVADDFDIADNSGLQLPQPSSHQATSRNLTETPIINLQPPVLQLADTLVDEIELPPWFSPRK
jgi:hypothetical protein